MLSKLFRKYYEKENVVVDDDDDDDDVVGFARTIERLIDETSLEIFREYKNTLLKESNVYIVPAVWGAVKNGELTLIQKEIHAIIFPAVKKILDLLVQPKEVNAAQEFAIGYLVRGLFISKIIYMIEFYKNLSDTQTGFDQQNPELANMEPLGHA